MLGERPVFTYSLPGKRFEPLPPSVTPLIRCISNTNSHKQWWV